ncbi:SH3 domain-containing protein [Mesorhizobium retamae]|uniref:SH3 domain-containing protein n=1 Tax=Mesorhizobium retamae TaxID=2912854 RepID=A0ABS9QMF1_9HYPH|nr:SH3 domain-containing protein [Mesorhizobium sp. IRAMC:0171]MCG7508615.1 SH3 domain-containing protein [Mesorhizobium sp. IRAMC:0171]
MSRKLFAVLALIGGLVISAQAVAASGYTSGNVNVRSGPGTGYAKIGVLTAGTRVSLRGCQNNWCNVRGAGLVGWISASFLVEDMARPPAVVIAPTIVVRPPHRPPHWHKPPHRPGWRPRPPRPGDNCKIAPGFPCRR